MPINLDFGGVIVWYCVDSADYYGKIKIQDRSYGIVTIVRLLAFDFFPEHLLH